MAFEKLSHQPSKGGGVTAANHSSCGDTTFTVLEMNHEVVPLREAGNFQRIQVVGVDQVTTPIAQSSCMIGVESPKIMRSL